MSPSGESPQTVIKEAGWSRPSWSADGSLLTFGAYGEWSGEVVGVAEANGPGIRFFRHASLESGNPVMAPDGRVVAYPYKNSIWLLNVMSGSVRRAAPWRLQTTEFEPSSFSAGEACGRVEYRRGARKSLLRLAFTRPVEGPADRRVADECCVEEEGEEQGRHRKQDEG